MPYSVITTTNARKDIQDAIDWENMRKSGLAEMLLTDIDQKLTALCKSPNIGSIRYQNVRCVNTKVFKYLIHYVTDDTEHHIIILRVLHTSRKPIW